MRLREAKKHGFRKAKSAPFGPDEEWLQGHG